jgi:hypothetical protein
MPVLLEAGYARHAYKKLPGPQSAGMHREAGYFYVHIAFRPDYLKPFGQFPQFHGPPLRTF